MAATQAGTATLFRRCVARVFGSRAPEQARENSDADVLIAFDGPTLSARYFGVQFSLEDLPACLADLVTKTAPRLQLQPFVERDAIHVCCAAAALPADARAEATEVP